MNTDDVKKIVIVSDGTGRTAKRLMDAVLVQYYHADAEFSLDNIYQNVRTEEEVERVLKQIKGDCLVLFSIVSRELSRYFHDRLVEEDELIVRQLREQFDIPDLAV